MVFKSEKWDELERLRDEVQELFGSEDPDHKLQRIVSRMNRIVELDPTDKFALFWLGKLWYQLEVYETALKFIEKLIKLDENYSSALIYKGNILTELKKEKEALECYDKLIKADSSYEPAYYNKGATLHNLGQYKEALECYERYVELDKNNSNDPDFLINKCKTLFRLGQNNDAIICYDRAIEMDSSLKFNMYPDPKINFKKIRIRRCGSLCNVIRFVVRCFSKSRP